MSDFEELRREARLEVKRVQIEAREKWGHIEGMNLDTPSYYQDILTRLADALESLNRENKEQIESSIKVEDILTERAMRAEAEVVQLNRENKELTDSLGAIDEWGRDFFGPVRWLDDSELDSESFRSPTHVLNYGPPRG